MRVLVIGGGGREHALVWKLRQSPRIAALYCAPGNAGIAEDAECVPIAADDVKGLLRFAAERRIDLTVVGPELPLTLGLVDRFTAAGLGAFGPTAAAARLEGSKAFTKELLRHERVPTAFFGVFGDPDDAARYVKEVGAPVVVKADGLAAGKGVVVAADRAGLRGAAGFCGGDGDAAPGLPHDQRVPQTPSGGAIGPVPAGLEAVPRGRPCEAWPCGARRHQDQGQCRDQQAMSYGRMKEAEPRLAAEVQRWFAEAAQTDKAEDRQFGASKRGDEMPDWMANKEKRLEKIRTAKAALEAEAKAAAEAKKRPPPPTPAPAPLKPAGSKLSDEDASATSAPPANEAAKIMNASR